MTHGPGPCIAVAAEALAWPNGGGSDSAPATSSATSSSPAQRASAVASGSHACGSISPPGSTSFAPLSAAGLCDAVIIAPVAAPASRARTATSRPQRKTVESSSSAAARKPAVPYDGVKPAGRGYDDEAAATAATSRGGSASGAGSASPADAMARSKVGRG
eukprot:320427-Chlamydomonas_euryale.AAC.3